MTTMFPKTFSPVRIRGRTLRNRIVFGAHTANMAEDGLPGPRHVAYYEERAIGGAGMIVVEPMPTHASTVLTRGNFRHADDEVIPHFRKVTDAVKRHGAIVIQQLYHVGSHGDSDLSFHAHWSPSGLPSYHDSDGSHEMSDSEIRETILGFVQAARRCREAGFDGVEIWAAYHALVDQFWTPWSNRREDAWGGSLENRTRLSREIASGIRETCGEDFIIGFAISDEPDVPSALSRRELAEIIALHDRAGLVDYVTCGSGSYFDFHKLMPTFLYPEKLGSDLAAAIKAVVHSAVVISESHVRTPENAETLLGEGIADLVSIVRGQIADPHLANKAREGRPEDVRGCLSCNQMCWGRRSRDYWISCLVNPSAGREFEWGGDRFQPTSDPKRVLVVGGGPAGLEAARVAAERGHSVVLAEASDKLGGAFRLAGLQPRRGQILDLINWYEAQLGKLGVEVRLNAYMDEDDVAAEAVEAIIVATGSVPADVGFQKDVPEAASMPGWELGNAYPAEAVMSRQVRPGPRVLVLDEGGNWKGCGTAWRLAEDGHQVVLVTPDPMVGAELRRTTADKPLRKALRRLGVTFMTEASIVEWHGDGATVRSNLDGDTVRVDADALVTATAGVAANWVAKGLQQKGVPFAEIGDGVAPRLAPFAIYEGRRAGLAV